MWRRGQCRTHIRSAGTLLHTPPSHHPAPHPWMCYMLDLSNLFLAFIYILFHFKYLSAGLNSLGKGNEFEREGGR